jgi:hypothetical protein
LTCASEFFEEIVVDSGSRKSRKREGFEEVNLLKKKRRKKTRKRKSC